MRGRDGSRSKMPNPNWQVLFKKRRRNCWEEEAAYIENSISVDPQAKAVICITFAALKEHDFHLFKRSRVKLKKETKCLVGKGYQGIQKIHILSQLPKKRRKGKQLSQLDREMNQSLERIRGVCEHIIGKLKVFKILAERYRNRRKRFGVRFNLIAGLYNYELGLSTPSWLRQKLYCIPLILCFQWAVFEPCDF